MRPTPCHKHQKPLKVMSITEGVEGLQPKLSSLNKGEIAHARACTQQWNSINGRSEECPKSHEVLERQLSVNAVVKLDCLAGVPRERDMHGIGGLFHCKHGLLGTSEKCCSKGSRQSLKVPLLKHRYRVYFCRKMQAYPCTARSVGDQLAVARDGTSMSVAGNSFVHLAARQAEAPREVRLHSTDFSQLPLYVTVQHFDHGGNQ